MADWIRQGTGTAPSATDADLVGNYALDNATAPVGFDPADPTITVRCQWTITGSGFNDDSWTNDSCALVGGVSNTEISQHPSAGGANLQNESEASDHTDSTGIPTGLTVADWEAAFVRGDGVDIPDEWVNWNKVMGPDGSTLTVSLLTVTISYTEDTGQDIAVGAATESETAQVVPPIPGAVSIAVVDAGETEAVQAIATQTSISISVGEALETELGQVVTPSQPSGGQSISVTASTETETSEPVSFTRSLVQARPDADNDKANWESAPTPGQDLFAQIDEAITDDTDYIFAEVL